MTSQHIIRVFQRKIFPSIYNLSIICGSREFSLCVYFKSAKRSAENFLSMHGRAV